MSEYPAIDLLYQNGFFAMWALDNDFVHSSILCHDFYYMVLNKVIESIFW